MTYEEKVDALKQSQAALLAASLELSNGKFQAYFPTDGPLRRELYVKHLQFMDGGKKHRERLFLAANRIGKTETVAYELTCHMTGRYPWWWTGRRFDRPVRTWMSGDTMLTTRDILQVSMMGPIDGVDTKEWSGMLPAYLVEHDTRKSGGVAKCLDQVWVKHKNGGRSSLEFKSHDQGRRAFQGTEIDIICLDEEPPDDVYTECLLRTMTTEGLILCSMTPLQGLTPFIKQFLETAVMPDSDGVLMPANNVFWPEGSAPPDQKTEGQRASSRLLVGATWDNAPHLSESAKAELWNSIPEFLRDARTKGIPQLGSGAIYPFSESSIRVTDFPLPKHWVRAFGLDTALSGTTAAAWGILDRETQNLYVYSVYKRSQAETAVHAEAMKARGLWIPGVGDAADVMDSDRTQFIALYRRYGFNLELPDKAVETGIQDVYDRMSAGKFKVFASCVAFFEEFRLYQRDEKGKVKKVNDHILDATRYLVRSGLQRAKCEPGPPKPSLTDAPAKLSWMR